MKDYLQELMEMGRVCTIRFKADNGAISLIRDRISDLRKQDDADWVYLGSGVKIREDQILNVDGRSSLGTA